MLVEPLFCFVAALATFLGVALSASTPRERKGRPGSGAATAILMIGAFGVGSCSIIVPFSEPFGSRQGPLWLGILALATVGTVAFVAGVRTASARRSATDSRGALRALAAFALVFGFACLVAAFWLAGTAT